MSQRLEVSSNQSEQDSLKLIDIGLIVRVSGSRSVARPWPTHGLSATIGAAMSTSGGAGGGGIDETHFWALACSFCDVGLVGLRHP
jgi:hypothetical protein